MGRKPTVKHTIAVLSCAAVLAASLTACGGSDAKATLPASTGGSSPSATTTSPPTTAAPSASASGPVVLAPHTTYTYGGLKVIVNLPANIPKASRTSMILSSDFLQGMGRTIGQNKLDPCLADLASADVVNYLEGSVTPGVVRTIGTLVFTISNIQARGSYSTRAAFASISRSSSRSAGTALTSLASTPRSTPQSG
jgi:hypothetical protein